MCEFYFCKLRESRKGQSHEFTLHNFYHAIHVLADLHKLFMCIKNVTLRYTRYFLDGQFSCVVCVPWRA